MKFVLWICLLIVLASLAACGSAATPTAPQPTATPPRPTIAPTMPPTATRQRPAATPKAPPPTPTAAPKATVAPKPTLLPPATAPAAIPTPAGPRPIAVLQGPAALLSALPGSSTSFYYFEVAPIFGREALHEGGLAEALKYLSERTEGILTEEIMLPAVDRVAIGQDRGSNAIGGAAVLQGDFRPIVLAMRDAVAAAAEEVIAAEVEEVYRETLIVKVSGGDRFPKDAYVALLEPATVVMGPTAAHLYPVLDGELDEGLKPVTGEDALARTSQAALTPVSLGEYSGVEIFRTHYRNYTSNFYIAVPDPSTMLFARSHGLITVMIDRYFAGEVVAQSVSQLLEGTAQVDFMIINTQFEKSALLGMVKDFGTTELQVRLVLEDEESAAQLEDRMRERREGGLQVEDLLREGAMVRYVMELADEEVGVGN